MKKLGKYEIIAELGRGAMGDVFQARDPLIGRLVALKTISGGLVGKPDLLARFYQEARSAGTLQHPNIVTIYELGKEGDTPYIAMEYLQGESLEKVIDRRQPLPLSQKLSFIVPVCRALEYAHKRGVVHRDIKPGNVMVTTEGSVKVVDFGIARLLDASRTQTGMLIGTLGYMSPQLIQGERADERSDIWAVGVMFYELVCYERPFGGENHAALMMNIMTKEPRPLGEAVPDCPADVAALVHRMLRKDISDRFQSMEEVLLELDAIWRHIQMQRFVELLLESKEKIAAQDFSSARELLRKALQIDTTSVEARTLLEKVNAELRRIKLQPQVKEHVERAQSLKQTGRLQEAKGEAEAALQLDPNFEPARDLVQQISESVERHRLFKERLRHAQQRLAEGALAEAGQQLAQALELDPSNPQAQELRREILQEKERQEKRARLLETMQRARGLWKQLNFTECLSLLDALHREFPSESEITKLREAVREDQTEQQKQQKLAEARALLAAKHLDQCLALLDQLQKEFPGEPEVPRLREAVREEQAEQQKQQRLAEARVLLAAKSFEPCLALLHALQKEYPREPEVTRLLAVVREEEFEQRKQQRLSEARSLLAAKRFDDCLALLGDLEKEYPREAEIAALLETVRSAQAEQQKQQRIAEARGLLAEKRFDECQAVLLELEKGFPDQPEITKLLEMARKSQGEHHKQEKLAEARGLLAEKHFEPCLAVLEELDKQFPGETEIAKLLATVRKTQAEQQKQQKLAEARSLLAEQRFDEALAALDALQELHPNDPAARKLYKIVQQEQEEQKRLTRLQQEREALKSLVNEEKYAEAVARGEKLLREFAGDFELARLVGFARAQQKQQEQAARLQQILKELQGSLNAGRYDAALHAAQRGLEIFPGDAELLRLREQAQLKQKEKEKRELLEWRVREIRAKINRDELTDAVTLARQTLVTLGQDTDVAQLLNSAQMELEQRGKKKAQDHEVDAARTLIEAGKLDEASGVIHRAVETELFDIYDPRVQRVLAEIEEKKKAPTGPARVETAWPKPAEPATAYVYEPAAPQQSAPTVPAGLPTAEAPAGSAVPAASTHTAPPPAAQPVVPPMAQPVPPPAQMAPPPVEQSASSPVTPPYPPRAPAPPAPPAAPAPPEEPFAPARPRAARPAPAAERPAAVPVPIWKRPTVLAAAALGLVAILWVGSHFLPRGGSKVSPSQPRVGQPGPKIDPIEARQKAAIDDANKRIAEKDFQGARQILEQAAQLQGPLTPQIEKMRTQVDAAIQDADLALLLQQEETLWQRALDEFNKGGLAEAKRSFQQISALFPKGRHRDEALQYVQVKIPLREKEERLFQQAQRAQQRGDKGSLQQAERLYGLVVALNGPRQPEAQQLQAAIRSRLEQTAREEQFASLVSGARQDLKRSDFRSARQKATQIRQSGGDSAGISGEIDQAEQTRFAQLESQFNQLKQRSDDAAVQQLKDLQSQFAALQDDAWARAAEARNYTEKLIPGAVANIQARTAAAGKADADFRQAVQRYEQAVSAKDRSALGRSQSEFQAIANSGGSHAAEARKYLAEIPKRISDLAPPPPPPVTPPTKTETSPGQAAGREAILAIVQQYAQAFERRDADALRKIWPSMGNKYEGYKASFGAANAIQMQVHVESVEIASEGTTAVVTATVSQVYTPKGAKPKSSRDKAVFRLRNEGSTWLITSME